MQGVVLVNMPFGSFRQPSLALGLLKATLTPLGVQVRVVDATLEFAAMISPHVYDAISTWPAVDMLGDHLFAALLPHPPPQSEDEYEYRILEGGAPEHAVPHFGKRPLDRAFRADLRTAGARVGELLDKCLAEIETADPAVVGFTSMSGQHAASLALAARVKAAIPGALVVFGGPNCRGMGAELLHSFPFVDAVAVGEGEDPLPALVRRRLAGETVAGIPGLHVRTDSGGGERPDAACEETRQIELDRLPWPDLGDYFTRLAGSPLKGAFAPRLPFETSRGCWWGAKCRCSFCGQASEDMTFRVKSSERALRELQTLTEHHPLCPVFVTDEIIPRGRLKDFFPALRVRIPDVEIVYLQARPTLDREELQTLARSGVRRLEVGIESLSTPILSLMRKGTTALRCVQFLKWARESRLDVVWNLIWGLPGEEPAEYERMAALLPLLTHLQPPHTVGAFRLDRFSPMFEDPLRFGLTNVRPYPASEYVYDLPPEALARLSWCFSYEPPRRVSEYTAQLATAVEDWKEQFTRSSLTFVDRDGRLALTDHRPGFDPEEMTILDGDHRALYLACDGLQADGALASLLSRETGRNVGVDEVASLLEPLVDTGLILREGRSYLALGLPVDAAGTDVR